MKQIIHTNCTKCVLHKTAYTVGIHGYGNPKAPLKIFMDMPHMVDDRTHEVGESKPFKLLQWLLKRLSLKKESYYVDFIIKCCPPKAFQKWKKWEKQLSIEACTEHRIASLQGAKAIVAMGELSCLAFTFSDLKRKAEARWCPAEPEVKKICRALYVCYSPGACIGEKGDAGVCVGISRILFRAATEAGLNPKVDLNVPVFDFEVI